jgi:hypothetical protein
MLSELIPGQYVSAKKNILAKRKGNSKAVVAAASKLLKVIYWVMKEKREYHV